MCTLAAVEGKTRATLGTRQAMGHCGYSNKAVATGAYAMAKLSTLPIASNIVCSDQEVLGGIQGTRVLFRALGYYSGYLFGALGVLKWGTQRT